MPPAPRPKPARWKKEKVATGIFRRPNGTYTIEVYHRGAMESKSGYRTLEEAKAARAARITETRTAPTEQPLSRWTPETPFPEFARDWMARKAPDWKLSTRRSTATLVTKYLCPSLRLPLHHLLPATIEAQLLPQIRTLHPKTQHNILGVLHTICEDAWKNRLLPANPVPAVTRPSLPRRTVSALSPTQVQTLLALLPSPIQEAVLLAAMTGLRQGELLALRWDAIGETAIRVERSRDQSGVCTTPKSDAGVRSVPIKPPVVAFLKDYRARQNPPSDYLFPAKIGKHKGKRNPDRLPVMDDARLRKAFAKACTTAQLETTFHGLRHAFASLLLSTSGQASLALIARALGHHNVAFTLKQYTHFLPDTAPTLLDGVTNAYAAVLPGAPRRTRSARPDTRTRHTPRAARRTADAANTSPLERGVGS